MITGLTQCGSAKNVVDLFIEMEVSGFIPDQFALSRLISDASVGCILVNMYVKCAVDGSVDASMRVFDQMLMHDVMSWTAIITGYVQSGGRDKEAIELFCTMKQEGVQPNQFTFSSVMSWTAIITGYVQSGGRDKEAIELFCTMKQEGVQPNQFTFSSVLKACAYLSDADLGEQVYAQVVKSSLASVNCVGNSFVAMYTHSGVGPCAFTFASLLSAAASIGALGIGSRGSRVVCALSNARLQDGYVSYTWEKKMKETLSVPNSSSFLSLLLLPKASDPAASRYNDLEDTLARANAWLTASQASGVPIVFMNVQTEALLTKISGETASATVNVGSLSDLSNLANESLYGFEDYHGVDIGVVRAVRLWYAPIVEVTMEIKLQECDSRLGFAISRTEDGFIYISSVADDDDKEPTASTRSGLKELYRQAVKSCKLLVVSRLANDKVLPWMVSPTGAIRCCDTVSLSQKLSLHRHALRPIHIHVFLWDRGLAAQNESDIRLRTVSPPMMPVPMPLPPAIQFSRSPSVNHVPTDGSGPMLRDTAGELSFRFHDFSLRSNWV
ncbi:hypothetical protein ACLOJK_038682 [Asimina triloba]